MNIYDFIWLGSALFVTYVGITVMNNHGVFEHLFKMAGWL